MPGDVLAAFVADVEPQFVPLVIALDEAVVAAMPLDAAIKWHQLVYAVESDFHHWLCAIAVAKKRVTLNFHFGALLTDEEDAFRAGSSKFMRMLDFESVEDVDAGLIGRRVREAATRLEYSKANWERIQREGQ